MVHALYQHPPPFSALSIDQFWYCTVLCPICMLLLSKTDISFSFYFPPTPATSKSLLISYQWKMLKPFRCRQPYIIFNLNIKSMWIEFYIWVSVHHKSYNIQGGTRNVIPLIVHVTHFYYYKNIWYQVES